MESCWTVRGGLFVFSTGTDIGVVTSTKHLLTEVEDTLILYCFKRGLSREPENEDAPQPLLRFFVPCAYGTIPHSGCLTYGSSSVGGGFRSDDAGQWTQNLYISHSIDR